MNKYIDIKLFKFLLVGVANTLFSTVLMFLFYNKLQFGYWGSSSVAYILSSILSFFLNKNFTFKNQGSIVQTGIKFVINIAICYMIAYTLAQPLVTVLLRNFDLSSSVIEQIAMLFGMVLFTGLNYFGQRFFAFKSSS